MTQANCVLKLLSQPHLNGILNGLKYQSSHLKIDASMFPCCEGTGQRTCVEKNSVEFCDLQSRLSQLQRLVKSARGLSEKPLSLPMSFTLDGALSQELGSIAQNQIHKGRIFRTEQNERLLWPYALAAAWRFGLNVLYVQPGKTFVPKALDELKIGLGHKQTILFIEPVAKLWEMNVLQDFSTLVDFSYNSLIPCWINIDMSGLQKTAIHSRSKYAERLSNHRAQDAMEFLPSACKNRLQAMCLGF